jgi:hypothetical protein
MYSRVLTFLTILLCLSSHAMATDFQLESNGVGPIDISATIQRNGSIAILTARAVNSSGEDIKYVKFCVAPRDSKKCNFDLWTTGVWKAGQELTWTLSGPGLQGIETPVVYIRKLQPLPVRVLKRVYAFRDGVPVFIRKDSESPAAGTLVLNERVEVLEQTTVWSKVRTKRFTGFARSGELAEKKITSAPQREAKSNEPSVWEARLQPLPAGLAETAPSQTDKLMIFGGPNHKTYLGCLNCSEYATDSVFNTYGKGSRYASETIWNHYSEFGSAYSTYGACNGYAIDPPVIVDEAGDFYGRLTLNRYHSQLGAGVNWMEWLSTTVCN